MTDRVWDMISAPFSGVLELGQPARVDEFSGEILRLPRTSLGREVLLECSQFVSRKEPGSHEILDELFEADRHASPPTELATLILIFAWRAGQP